MRTFIRATCLVLAVVLLTTGIFFFSRYVSNRRLMNLHPMQWEGQTYDWLRRWINQPTQMALFGRPIGFVVQDNPTITPDSTILEVLKSCSGLTHIYIQNRDLPDSCLEIIANQHRPEALYFRLPVIRAEDARTLSRMTSLKYVNIGQFIREPRTNDWSWLSRLPKLSKLEVTLWGATDDDVLALASCPASQNLALNGESLSDKALEHLCDLPALHHLDLEGQQIRLHFAQGRKLPDSLESFELCSPASDAASLDVIAELPRINRVSLRVCGISDPGMKTLAALPSLRQLWLDELHKVTDAGLKALTPSTSLSEVHIVRCGTTPLGLIHLDAIPNWSELRFEDVSFPRPADGRRLSLTADSVEARLEDRRRIQEMQSKVFNGPAPYNVHPGR